MAEEEAAHHLLNVIEERGLDIDLDKVLEAFEDEDTKRDTAAWVREYLNEETLLTKEELELYETLKAKGMIHQYEAEDEPIRPILDHELVSAIDSLQSSTAAIEAQSRVLEAQRDALMRLKALEKPNLEVEHLRNERRRKEHQEKVRLNIAVNDISTSINEQLTDAQREIEAEKTVVRDYLTGRLKSDDEILSRLPGIVSQIVAEPKLSDDEKSVEQWCKAIISYRAAEIRARVDTVYLESLSHSIPEDLAKAPETELAKQKTALQADLDELHSQIASVAEMVVDHELGNPLLSMKERKERRNRQARSAWLRYVLLTLEYMGRRLETVSAHTKTLDEFQQALVRISETAATQMPPELRAGTATPPRRRATFAPKSVFSPAVKLKPSKSLDLPPALQDALRHASISFNQDSIEDLIGTLGSVVLERQKRLQDHYESSCCSAQEGLAERLSKADADSKTILGALYSHTPFQEVHLTNPKLESRLRDMETELDRASEQLLEAEASELSLSDPKVRAFIAKYGK